MRNANWLRVFVTFVVAALLFNLWNSGLKVMSGDDIPFDLLVVGVNGILTFFMGNMLIEMWTSERWDD
jgi:hypothetical protein